MLFTLILLEAADPVGPRVVFTVSAEYVMNLIDKTQRKILVFFVSCLPINLQKVADGKSVGP